MKNIRNGSFSHRSLLLSPPQASILLAEENEFGCQRPGLEPQACLRCPCGDLGKPCPPISVKWDGPQRRTRSLQKVPQKSPPFRRELSLGVGAATYTRPPEGPTAQLRLRGLREGGASGACSRAGAGTEEQRRPPSRSARRLDACSPGGSRALSQQLVNRPRTKSR